MRGGGGGGGVVALRPPWKPAPTLLAPEVVDNQPDTGRTAGGRKKGAWVRAWLAVDAAGRAEVVEAGKHTMMRRAGLPARDLRILDPLLSYPSTILGRERAIVANLEHVKAVITANDVLLLNYRDPSVEPFVRELKRRLARRHNRLHGGGDDDQQEGGTGENSDWANVYDIEEPRSRSSSTRRSDNVDYSGSPHEHLEEDIQRGSLKSNLLISDMPRFLPFEFVALEACLDAACSCLEHEAITLEKEAHPALDKLTSKISTLNLERVRQIKSRLMAITGRVQKVRDELEHLLDDDDDMAEMYLTDKLMRQHLSNGSSAHSLIEEGSDLEDERSTAEILLEETDIHDNIERGPQNIYNHDHLFTGPNLERGNSYRTHTCSTRSSSKHLDVEELEMLLEAYFVQIDSTLNKLSTLREYVDDTEDYINIMLDDKQNQLLQVGVVLTTATLVLSAFISLVGIFGMNINIDLFDRTKASTYEFAWTLGGGATCSLFLYIMSIAWCKRRRLLE